MSRHICKKGVSLRSLVSRFYVHVSCHMHINTLEKWRKIRMNMSLIEIHSIKNDWKEGEWEILKKISHLKWKTGKFWKPNLIEKKNGTFLISSHYQKTIWIDKLFCLYFNEKTTLVNWHLHTKLLIQKSVCVSKN